MQPLTLTRPADLQAAIASAATAGTKYIAGGTDLLQLAKDEVETPNRLVDLEPLGMAGIHASSDRLRLEPLGMAGIHASSDRLRLEPLARMSDVAAHPAVAKSWPVLSQALLLSASPQVRNMGTMGGNLLQRTRCGYFRDTGFACNKRVPGSGCPAIRGENRNLAILGGSDACIATNPSDMAVALVALEAELELTGPDGARRVPIGDFHRLPGDTPHIETVLRLGEMITAIDVAASPMSERSYYLKVRDRASFEWAVVSVAVAIQIDSGTVRSVRVAAGGVGTKPWRLPEVEAALTGRPVEAEALRDASERAGAGAKPASMNAFKTVLLKRSVHRALQHVTA